MPACRAFLDHHPDASLVLVGTAEVLSQAQGWRIDSIGAYFAYLAHPFAGVPAAVVAERLAATRGVLGLPGSYFGPGQDGHLRIAFANADSARIAALPERLHGLAA